MTSNLSSLFLHNFYFCFFCRYRLVPFLSKYQVMLILKTLKKKYSYLPKPYENGLYHIQNSAPEENFLAQVLSSVT